MKAVYVTSLRNGNKDSKNFGKTFHIYNIVGTVAEIEDYKNSPSFKQYPSFGANGEVQFLTNYISMEDEVNFIKKKDGNFTLDNSAFNKDTARLNAIAEASTVLADKFADRLADKLTSSVSAKKRTVEVKFEEETAEETTEDTTDSLDKM